jgi:hypothetical protein
MADDEKYKKALENVESMLKKQEALNKSADKLKNSWNAISSQIFGLDGAAFFKQIPLSVDEIKKLNDTLRDTDEQIRVLGKEFGDALDVDEKIGKLTDLTGAAFAKMTAEQKKYGAGTKEAYKAEMDFLAEIRDKRKEFAALSDDDLKLIGKTISEKGTLSQIYDELEEKSKNIIKANSENPAIFIESEMAAKDLYDQLEKARKELETGTKEAFSLKAGLQAAFSNVAAGGLKSLMEFDQTINDVQKNTGIMMDDNSAAFADLTTRVAVFGVSAAKAGEYMTAMSDELNTTNFSVLSKAAEDFALIEGATGASADEITTIGGQLMRMGQSSADVKDYMEGASQMAKRFGLNSKKAIGDISKNISKMRSMGFVGGEKSLANMVVTAQKLNMNVDEIFDVAKKARTIEGAMEMASELQLAGGSFANINPMDLLAAARKGPEELQKILTTMGKDVGKFNADTGTYEFDPVDVERLQMVADATGQTLDSVMNGIQKGGLDKVKLDPFKDMMGGLDDADKAIGESALGDMMKWDEKKKKFVVDADNDMAKKMGITDLDQINGDNISQMIKMKKEEDETLEKQNTRNQAFQESLTNFWMALQSIFSVFQPILEVLTTVMQSITSVFGELPGWSKWLIAGLLLFGTSFGASVLTFIGNGVMTFASSVSSMIAGSKSLLNPDTWKNLGKSVVGGMKDAWGTVKDVFTGKFKRVIPGGGGDGEGGDPLSDVKKTAGESDKIKPESGGGLKGFVESLRVMSKTAADIDLKGIFNLAFSMAMLAAPIGIMAYLFSGVDPMLLLAFGGVLIEQAIALSIMSKILQQIDLPAIIKGALAMGIISLALIPFAWVASQLQGVNWMGMLAGMGVLALLALGVAGLGFLIGPIALGTAALVVLSVGLLAISGAMMLFAPMSQMMQGMDFSWMANLGWALLSAAPGLLLGGIALGFATPFLLFGSLGLMAISQAALVASQVDWAIISGMGDALSQAAGGLFLFSLSAVMFTSPFVLAGIFFMVMAITALAAVMVPLATSLQLGASSLTNFAIGLERLSAAADTLSDEKLAKLQKISEAMAKASASGNVAGAMANTAEAAGGGGGNGGVRKIEVDVKLNGREIQSFIVKDTAIAK